MWPSLLCKRKKGVAVTPTRKTWNNPGTEQMTNNVCACVTKLSLNTASVHRKYAESITTQMCGACDTCKHKGQGEPNRQSASNSACLGHGSKSVKQTVEWSTIAPRGRHIRMISDVLRMSARVVRTHYKIKKEKEQGERMSPWRHQEAHTPDDPVQECEHCWQDPNAWSRRAHELSEQEMFTSLTYVDP